jgi:hypothetical protein
MGYITNPGVWIACGAILGGTLALIVLAIIERREERK